MRHFLQKLSTGSLTMNLVRGYYVSEKLDGIRVFWDGVLTTGMLKKDVPFANTLKDARFLREQVCTGLWSQYCHPIYAPAWFTASLPKIMMEGELFAGRGTWQKLSSATSRQEPVNDEWDDIKLIAFDCPDPYIMFEDGLVRINGNDKLLFRGCLNFLEKHNNGIKTISEAPYSRRRAFLRNNYSECIEEVLMYSNKKMLNTFNEVISKGGEGLVLKTPDNIWNTDRAKDALKIKPLSSDEATVIGFTAGRIGKTGKFHGMIGNFICKWRDIIFELSGMDDLHRTLVNNKEFAYSNPGKEMPSDTIGLLVRPGTRVTFEYRELSNDGLPKEARFIRVRKDHE